MSLASNPTNAASVLGLRRRFTSEGIHPYEMFEWERRDARIHDFGTGEIAFEQGDVEVPARWSVNASNILAQKYFRGQPGTAERESSLRQVVDRVVGTITKWGIEDGYFVDDRQAQVFADELAFLIVDQRAAFNSPVWFNIGVPGVPQQASACFILSVEDRMDSILEWYAEEGMIFKGGSGAGVNLSRIRSSSEPLNGGGTASGPVSFMRGADASAGTIKSGGKTRRAAKMVVLDVDHPDVEEFVWCKAREEQKARALRDAGFDMDLDGVDNHSVQYQNANNSVRVTDEFMSAVVDGEDWELRAVTDGRVVRTVPARDLMRQIAQAAWECADPGVQYDTTINRWHTTPNAGRINASNPCFPGDALVHTDRGLIRFDEIVRRLQVGQTFQVYTHDVTNDDPSPAMHLTSPEAVMITGVNPIVELDFANGMRLRCTPNHSLFVSDGHGSGRWVAAEDLTSDDAVCTLDLEAPPVGASLEIPIDADEVAHRHKYETRRALHFPEKWTEEFAHYLGWVVGDGCISGGVVSAIYGTIDEQDAFVRYLEALGLSSAKAPEKTIPWSIFEAPGEIVRAFLRGLFDADGTVVVNASKGHHVGLGSTSRELLQGAQLLLTQFGIRSRIHATRGYDSAPMFDLRISSSNIDRFAHHVGFDLPQKSAQIESLLSLRRKKPYETATTTTLADRRSAGFELTYNLTEPRNHSYVVNGLVVRNCSEYVHLDDSACNLASLNLLAFLPEGASDISGFDIEGFISAVEIVFTAQEILVGRSDYPTERIAENARAFRQLGLGYANLGALLMAVGAPYDAEPGRALAASVTALMAGAAYNMSTRLAERVGPFDGYEADRESMLRVLGMHRAAVSAIDGVVVAPELLAAADAAWDDTCVRAAQHGVRNAQATVLAPTGTISFLMDCDTTGIEPDLGLVKTKKLVGGGTMQIVNRSVARALEHLGYTATERAAIEAHIQETGSVIGAPDLDEEHIAVFACSMGDNTIAPSGHIEMMAAVQPFLSGAISKTVNLPESVSVEDVEQVYIDAWRLGLKAVAIYRDNCKVGQPLSAKSAADQSPASARNAAVVGAPVREKLPRARQSRTFEFRVADCKGFFTVGEYADGRPGELFIRVSKQGSTLAGIMDAFAISVSHGLQYGVPLDAFVDAFVGMRFEPAGMTDDDELRIASSLMDYLFRRLAVEYLTEDERRRRNILTVGERSQPTLPGVAEAAVETSQGLDMVPDPPTGRQATAPAGGDAPFCGQCGTQMIRAGSCFACRDCGSTSGCS